MLADGGLQPARIDVVSRDVVLQAADQRRHQCPNGVVHLALVGT